MTCKCGKELFIKMEYLGTPLGHDREYYCSCGAVYKGRPEKNELREITTFVEKELK